MICLSDTTATREPRSIVGSRVRFCGGYGTGPLHKLCSLNFGTARYCRRSHRAIEGFVGTESRHRVVFAHGTARDLGLITCDCKVGFLGGNSRVLIAMVRRRDGRLP